MNLPSIQTNMVNILWKLFTNKTKSVFATCNLRDNELQFGLATYYIKDKYLMLKSASHICNDYVNLSCYHGVFSVNIS